MFTMAMQYYSIFKSRQAYDATKESLVAVDNALLAVLGLEGHYPCPADPTLPPNHPDYGRALPVCNVCIDETTRPFLSDGITESNVICSNEGTRDVDGDGANEFVLIGAIPFRTLYESTSQLPVPFIQANGLDGYNNLFTYAVTEDMTSNAFDVLNPVNPYTGAVRMIDENGIEMSDPVSSAQFVIVSHGKNGRGGYTLEGTQIDNCFVSSTGVPPAPGYQPFGSVAGLNPELENCDANDGVFTKALLALNEDDSYFDDIVYFRNRTSTGLWSASPGSVTGDDIYNTNVGDVGVNTDAPLAKLHIVGTARVDTEVQAEQGYCDNTHIQTGTDTDLDCLNPALLGSFDPDPSERWACGNGQVAIGIQDNQLICEDLIINPASVQFNVSCTPPEYPTGLRFERTATPPTFTQTGCAIP